MLQVDSRTPRAFTDDDTQFLRGYANLLAAAVERLRIVRSCGTGPRRRNGCCGSCSTG